MFSNNKDIILSVLVPVYGVEKYIERYARSLFEQSMTKNVEFVFIDDCSKDNSIPILQKVIEDYPSLKEQIRIERLPQNMGLLGARLSGLKMVKGDYILCNDSDDWVEPTMLEDMYNKAITDNCDVVIADYFVNTNKKQICISQKPEKLDGLSCANQILNSTLHGSWCNKLFKRNLVVNSNIIEPQLGMNMMEDLMVTTQLLFHSKKVGYVDKAYYHYFLNTSSVSQTVSEKKLQSIQYAYDFIEKFYHLNNLNDSESLKALKFFRISTLSTIAYESCLTDYSVDFWKYRKLLPSILKHPKLDIVHQLSLIFRILKMKPLVKLMIVTKKIKAKI